MGVDPSEGYVSCSEEEFIPDEEEFEEEDDEEEEEFEEAKEQLQEKAEDKEEDSEGKEGDEEEEKGEFGDEKELGNPIQGSIILTPPLGLPKDQAPTDGKQKNVLLRVLDLLKAVRPGSDLTKLRVPPQFNLPKSQLQLYGESIYCCGYGEDLLLKCIQGASPLERFLAVVRWHISTTRPPPFGKAPYNPVLGETHHVSFGMFNFMAEQVSHHPPVTAVHVTDQMKKLRMTWWHQPVPHFYGNGVKVTIHGRRVLSLLDFNETYEFTSPNLDIRLFPVPGADWVGDTSLFCEQTSLKATISFKGKGALGLKGGKRRISGEIWDCSSDSNLYVLSGNWDNEVNLMDKELEKSTRLYDGRDALRNMKSPVIQNIQDISSSESVSIWSRLTKCIVESDWIKARIVKNDIEEHQRTLRKQRQEAGVAWIPRYFRHNSKGDWEWSHPGELVNIAPIFVP